MNAPTSPSAPAPRCTSGDLQRQCLSALERKVLWLSVWMIHHANHIRTRRDGLKVGGHQASCASMVSLMTALYFDVLRPRDRVAVKPHGSPVFHAIQYLLGRQTRDQLERFGAFGGAQSYPSRSKDVDDVDISTGSVGMGVAMTSFAALAQEFLRKKQLVSDREPPGRMIALAGDAEFDEGNIFEALLEAWKHQVTNVWWIIDYNRQSLDAIVNPPQSCILGVGAARPRPIVTRDTVAVATAATCTLSADHRAIDGATGARLLAAIRTFIEEPALLAL